MKIFLIPILIVFLFNSLTVSAQSWLWAKQGSCAGFRPATNLWAKNIATNKTGNAYQAGGFEVSLTFGADTLSTSSFGDVFLVKYDQNGNLLWARQSVSDTSTDSVGYLQGAIAYSVASDDSDNSYVTGITGDTTSFGLDTLYQHRKVFLVKYDPNGNVLWAKQPGNNIVNYTIGWAVATDNFGHEYVTGDGVFLIKYDRNGNIIWTLPQKSKKTFQHNIGFSVATDVYGNIYMAGQFKDSLTFGTHTLYSANQGVFIAKFDSNGNVLWANQSTNNPCDSCGYFINISTGEYSVAADRSGSAYLTGTFSNQITFGSDTFTTPLPSNNFYVIKFDPAGTIVWGKEATVVGNNNNGQCSYSISTDDSNHVYISGAANWGPPPLKFVFDADTFSFPGYLWDSPCFLAKLDSSGNLLCSSILDARGRYPNAIVSDATGKFVYFSGPFYAAPLILSNDTLTPLNGNEDVFVARWQACHPCDLVVTNPQSFNVCKGSSIILTVNGGTNYTWSPSTGLNTTTGDSVIVTTTTNTTYTISGINKCGVVTTQAIVTVLPAPNKPTITREGDVLTSSSTQGNQWNINDTSVQGAINQTYTISKKGCYSVMVTNPAFGCTSTSDTTCITPTGINKLSIENNQLSVYPNPTTGEIMININKSVGGTKGWVLQITDVLGRTVYTNSLLNYSNDIDLSNLSNGVYFITVINKSERTAVPLIKQNLK